MVAKKEIDAFQEQLEELKELYWGKYVVFHGDELVGAYDDLGTAALEAGRRFGQDFYVRQVGSVATVPVELLKGIG